MRELLEEVTVSEAGGVRWIRMARPEKKNALTPAMYDAMAQAIASAEDDLTVGAIVLASQGPTFTAGNDLGDFLLEPPAGYDSPVFRFLRALARATVPIVAAVPGAAIGIGTTMLLHCDFIYATPQARFHLPFIDLGVVPEAASSLLLPRLMGHARAAEMLLLGRPLNVEAALAAGLVSAVVDAGELEAVAAETANALASKPRLALRESKKLLRADVREIEARMSVEGEVFARLVTSPEARAAFTAFFARRQAPARA
jgi:enoyl-CoA hydratase/carnithine racemase